MKTIQITLLGLIAILMAFTSSANPPDKPAELLIPVDASTYDRLYKDNEFYIRQQLYFAKKHRIVKINTDLLMNDSEPFTITAFSEVKFKVFGNKKAQPTKYQRYIWDGELSDPRVETDDEELNKRINAVTLYISPASILYDAQSDHSNDGMGVNEQNRQVSINTVSGEIKDHLGKKTVVIEVLPYNPDYNLVYLEDERKKVGEGYKNASERSNKLDKFLKELHDEEAKRKGQEK